MVRNETSAKWDVASRGGGEIGFCRALKIDKIIFLCRQPRIMNNGFNR